MTQTKWPPENPGRFTSTFEYQANIPISKPDQPVDKIRISVRCMERITIGYIAVCSTCVVYIINKQAGQSQ